MGEKPTQEEAEWMREVEKLMGKKLPDDMRERLVKRGWIEQKLGGYVLTSKGHLALRR